MASNIDLSSLGSSLFEILPVPNHSIKETTTLLYGAVLRGSLEQVKGLIKDLLAQGGSLDGDVMKGNTFLHIAAKLGHTEIAMELLEQGASLNSLNDNGRTPLEIALIHEQDETSAILLSIGGTRESVDRKILAHIWGIKGDMKLDEKTKSPESPLKVKKVKYEGLPSALTQVPFINHTRTFFKSKEFNQMNSKLNPGPLLEAVEKIPENKTRPPKEVAQDVLDGKLVLQQTGWTKHATAIGFSEKVVIKTNCARKRGMEIKQPVNKLYTMKKTDQLEKCIEGIQKRDDRAFFDKTIDELLELVPLDELVKTAQKGGHCSWASLKAQFHSALEIECAKVYSQQDAKVEAHRIYKAWKYYVSHVALRSYLATSNDRDASLTAMIMEKNKKRERSSKFWGAHVFQMGG